LNEDVFPIENRDFPNVMLVFVRGVFFNIGPRVDTGAIDTKTSSGRFFRMVESSTLDIPVVFASTYA